jgi:hypothetical protein
MLSKWRTRLWQNCSRIGRDHDAVYRPVSWSWTYRRWIVLVLVQVQGLTNGFSPSISFLMILFAQVEWLGLLREVSLDIDVFKCRAVPEEANRTILKPITWSSNFQISFPARVIPDQRLLALDSQFITTNHLFASAARSMTWHWSRSAKQFAKREEWTDDTSSLWSDRRISIRKAMVVDIYPRNHTESMFLSDDESSMLQTEGDSWNPSMSLKCPSRTGKDPSVRFLEEMRKKEFQFGKLICKCAIHGVALADD